MTKRSLITRPYLRANHGDLFNTRTPEFQLSTVEKYDPTLTRWPLMNSHSVVSAHSKWDFREMTYRSGVLRISSPWSCSIRPRDAAEFSVPSSMSLTGVHV